MRALVTGIAGFIGSHLAEALLADGWSVLGIDAMSGYYDLGQKRKNLRDLGDDVELEVIEGVDLTTANLDPLLDEVDVVFHQAGQPGVRASWEAFEGYVADNIVATQRLLESARRTSLDRFVYASSSSVYGDALSYPTVETDLPRPKSPYGVTKLAAEHLCLVYARNWGMRTVALRYFTVYGPRQRPDMAMHRLVEASLHGTSFPLFGTGEQVRDFTYVGDIVIANVLAATADVPPGTVMNIAGGASTTLNEVIAVIEDLTGRTILLDRQPIATGDVHQMGGATDVAAELLGWKAQIDIHEGLSRQVEWHRARLGVNDASEQPQHR